MNEEALDAPAQSEQGASEGSPRPRRRRRRGGRGRSSQGKAQGSETDEPSEAKGSAGKSSGSETKAGGGRSSSRRKPAQKKPAQRKPAQRKPAQKDKGEEEPAPKAEAPARRRRRRSSGSGAAQRSTEAKPKETPKDEGQKEQAPRRRRGARGGRGRSRQAEEKPAAAKGTRTRSRKKSGGRPRQAPVRVPRITGKLMLITERGERDQIAVVEGRDLVEHYVTRVGAISMVGNIYLGKVQNVLPGMEAAFVDVGRGRNAVLYAGEVSYDEEIEGEERRIEQALKAGQKVLVQVTKDPMGGKGARLTGQVSLPGRYLVYVPDGGASGISRRLPEQERIRLRDIVKKIRPKKAGVIVRTAAEGASEEELTADLERLKKQWDSINRKSKRGKAPRPLYEEPELTVRVVRDVFSPGEFEKISTDSKGIHERIVAYLEDVAPDLIEKVELHEGPLPVFEEHHIAEQIHKALERKVWLPSGGYLIMDRSEAMTIVDVNTGKHVGKSNLEQTVAETNVEAAKEIARQLRLRDIGGIIVIDFIDMLLQQNRELVIKTLKRELAKDRTRSQVFEITPLGLLEMTRKRVSAGLVESFSETCPTCEGRGILLTHET